MSSRFLLLQIPKRRTKAFLQRCRQLSQRLTRRVRTGNLQRSSRPGSDQTDTPRARQMTRTSSPSDIPSIACIRCRHRKKKCDHSLPKCGECKRAGSECVRFQERKARDAASVPWEYVKGLEMRLAHTSRDPRPFTVKPWFIVCQMHFSRGLALN